MRSKLLSFLAVPALLGLTVPVFAHHGAAAYDESKEVVQKNATVAKFTWANPHTIIQYDVKDDSGNVAHWAGELGSPSALPLQGWTKSSVKPGDVITVYIHQSKTGNPVGRISRIVTADGTTLRDSSGTSGGYTDAGAGGGGRGGRGGAGAQQ
jgi:hypothetical protein